MKDNKKHPLANEIHRLVTKLQCALMSVCDHVENPQEVPLDLEKIQDALGEVKQMTVHKEVGRLETSLLSSVEPEQERKTWLHTCSCGFQWELKFPKMAKYMDPKTICNTQPDQIHLSATIIEATTETDQETSKPLEVDP